jgi:ABC-type arginine transport system ATPase subunit
MKIVKPSSSYELVLPEGIIEQPDGRVTSFWVDGEQVLLQVSSYIREEGRQVTALDRLNDRIKKDSGVWNIWAEKIHLDGSIDQATAEMVDDSGLLWLHSYLVWPHLTVYSTISGPKEAVRHPDNWARCALKSVRLRTH